MRCAALRGVQGLFARTCKGRATGEGGQHVHITPAVELAALAGAAEGMRAELAPGGCACR